MSHCDADCSSTSTEGGPMRNLIILVVIVAIGAALISRFRGKGD